MYKFYYRKRFFWKSIDVVGHQLDKIMDRMDLYLLNGLIMSISGWHLYDLKLKADWVLDTKKQMEKEAGQQISLNIDLK